MRGDKRKVSNERMIYFLNDLGGSYTDVFTFVKVNQAVNL